ncbi:MAG TPA: hypothetical protein VK087_02310 [Tissierellaceae bacterium]|nr:hypothetical protein [Tissierellaceae bacterium]
MNIRKLIAPLIIISFIIIYFLLMIVGFINISAPLGLRIIIILIYLILIGISISVLISRIKELRSDEKDDLSKY